jgi:nicotinamide mononucleotide transporter
MDLNSFLELFAENVSNTSVWEIIAVVFGIASVWFARKANILVFPTGIVSTVIYIFICFFARFYADMGINAFYTGMSFYGWYMWTRKDAREKVLPIKWNTNKQQITGVALIPILYVFILGLIWLFNKEDVGYMRSYVPYVDSFTTSIFLIAMWFMARKRVENWIYWIAGNIISIPMYFAKGLVFTSFQFSVFLILAIMGFVEWRKRAEING